ncbi:MAG: HP1 family phage holin [Pseudomonadota bacterium]
MHNGPSNAMFGGAVFSLLAGLTLNEWAALIGIIVAPLGVAFNVWHKWKIRQMQRERLDFEMKQARLAEPSQRT